MHKPKTIEEDTGMVFLSIDLLLDRKREGGSIGYRLSIPGRTTAVRRLWRAPYGVLTTAELEDFINALSQAASEAIVSWVGVQDRMPME